MCHRWFLLNILLICCLCPSVTQARQDTTNPTTIYIHVWINEYSQSTFSPGQSNFSPAYVEALRDTLLENGIEPVFIKASDGDYPDYFKKLSDYPDSFEIYDQALSLGIDSYDSNDAVSLSPYAAYQFPPLPMATPGWTTLAVITPENPETLASAVKLGAGMVLYIARQCEAALPYLEAAGEDPQLAQNGSLLVYTSTHFYQGNCDVALGNTDGAVDNYLAVLEDNIVLEGFDDQRVFSDSAAINLAWVYIGEGKTAEASQLLHQYDTVDLSPYGYSARDMGHFLQRSDLYLALGEKEAAITEMTRLIGIVDGQSGAESTAGLFASDEVARLYAERGWRYAQIGMLDAALADYNTAVETDPAYPKAYYWRALLYYAREDYASALADFEQFLALAPGYANYYEEDLVPLQDMAAVYIADINSKQ